MTQNNNTKTTKNLRFFGIPKIWPYVRKYNNIFIPMAIMGVIATAIDSVYPLFNRYAIDHFVALNTVDTLPVFIVLYLGILLIQVADNYINICYCGKMEMYIDRDLRNDAFNHIQELSFSYFNQNSVGYIHARVISDAGKIGELVAWRIMDVVWNGSYLIFIAIMMLILNAKLALVVLTVVPAAVILIGIFQRKLVEYNRKVRENNAVITADINEGITGTGAIKTMVVEDKMMRLFHKDTESMRHLSVRTAHFSSLFASTVTFLSSVALAIVLYYGGVITINGLTELGTLSIFMSYALGMIEPVQFIVGAFSAMIGIRVNIERFSTLMETTSDVTDDEAVTNIYGDTFNPKRENWEELKGDIEFENVDFVYPDGEETVLSDFNLKIPAGTNVAIVGETGAGKSTLVNLVCRFFEPTKGRVLIDGRDARERSQLWLHSNIGYVLQTPHLFSGSIRDNLIYGCPDATDEQIMEALRLVSAEFIVEKTEGGLDAQVGEDGGMLSVGEKQLISFARAIIADPKILVLDEATSSVDTVTEKIIQEAIEKVIKGRTSFVIAHRLSTIVNADVILLVSDGKIIERGTHRELMDLRGSYYELFTRQYENMVVDMV